MDDDTAAPATSHRRYLRHGGALLLALGAIVVLVDQITKIVAVAALEGHPPVEIIGSTVRLVLLRNSGAAFSMGTGLTPVLTLVAAAVVATIIVTSRRVHSRWWAWGLGLVLGGAAGNLVDRFVRSPGVLRGHVVDFVSVGWWPVFNVADSCLVAGVIVVAVAVMLGEDRNGLRDADRDAVRDADPELAGTDGPSAPGLSDGATRPDGARG